jgi:fructose-bisphosphate aldolase class II
MNTLKEYMLLAQQHKIAIGHFNFSTITMLRGIIDAARELSQEIDHPYGEAGIPIIVGVSEGDRKVFGTREAVAVVTALRDAYQYPLFINADHTHGVDAVKECIDMGYDMVIYDAVKLHLDENIKNTREVVEYKNTKNPDCIVEAELGFIGSGSDIKKEIPVGVCPETMTKPDEALQFIQATGIDALAPSVGNIHGVVTTGSPHIDIQRITDLQAVLNPVGGIGSISMVLHGGSGTPVEDFAKAAQAGMNVIHISTDIRSAYRACLEEQLKATDSVAPDVYILPCQDAVKEVTKKYIQIFTN